MPRIQVISILVLFLVGFYCDDNYEDYIDYFIKVRIFLYYLTSRDVSLSLSLSVTVMFRTMVKRTNPPGDFLSMVLLNLLQPYSPPYKIPSLKRRTLVRKVPAPK